MSEFGDKYDVNNMEYIGSGSVAQTYKLKLRNESTHHCIKVMHPDARSQIDDACEMYKSVKYSYFFPNKLKNVCWMFFESLDTQTNMDQEYTIGLKYRELFQSKNIYHPDKSPYVLVPQMIKSTYNCLAMEYIDSIHISSANIDEMCEKYGKMNMTAFLKTAISFVSHTGITNGLHHLDLHIGNIGYIEKGNSFQIVVYDMGQMYESDPKYTQMYIDYIRDYSIGDLYKVFPRFTNDDGSKLFNCPKVRIGGKLYIDTARKSLEMLLSLPNVIVDDDHLWLFMGSIKCANLCNLYESLDNGFEHMTEREFVQYIYPIIGTNIDDWLSLFHPKEYEDDVPVISEIN
jgi:hypothetical protein